MLTDEGALVLKFWLHLSKQQQRDRLETLQRSRRTRWRVTERDWKHHRRYDKLRAAAECAIAQTSTAEAPWLIVSGHDANLRNLTVGQYVLDALRKRLETRTPPVSRASPAPIPLPAIDRRHLLSSLDLAKTLGHTSYSSQLEKCQGRLNLLSRDPRFRNTAVAVVFEGNDAAGKGGAIRRVTAALDARMVQVVPIAAPSDEERAQPYLWRFWRHVPGRGRMTLFDRSWYGRVLVERVEGYCGEADWMRAYGEITDFESQLTQHGIVVVKFWLSISRDEQLRRFKERESTGFKRFKITEEDWRNRDKWDRYEAAVCDMVDRTSTEGAPWTLVEANDKAYARIKILKTLCQRIEQRLAA
jgi:polyphosphate:AMP phosphotransferase